MINKLSIVMPVYNEEKTLVKILERVLKAPLTIGKEIIIVDDGSTDRTKEILEDLHKYIHKRYISKADIVIVSDITNYGKGHAVRIGIRTATGGIVIIQDADLEYDPRDYQNVINPILRGEADVVYGSRWLNKKDRCWAHFSAFLGGRIVTWASRFFCPYIPTTDEPTCYKAFKTELIQKINLTSNGFEFCPEVTAKLSKLKPHFQEVPIHYYPRTIAEGKKINWKDGVKALYTLICYSNIWQQGTKFILVGGTALIMNLTLIYIFTEFVGLWYMFSVFISAVITAIFNFLANRFWTFRA